MIYPLKSICTVHPVFHVSMLEPTIPNTFLSCFKLSPPPVLIDGKPEYKIFWIIDLKIDCRQACKLFYKIT